MKIGIMSMQRVINYGSYMQALSLKQIVESLGHEVEFVDFRVEDTIYEKKTKHYSIKKIYRKLKNSSIIWKVRNIIKSRDINYRPNDNVYDNKREKKFISQFSKINYDYFNRNYNPQLDVLIIGSDEVFNCLQASKNVGFSMELFGKNNNANRLISYAASFGDTTYERLNNCDVVNIVGKYLKKFDAISVRDENSKTIVNKLTGKDCLQHFDPVFVGNLEEQEWKNNNLKEYVGIYAYGNRINENEAEAILEFCSNKKLKPIGINGKQNFCENIEECYPDEILSYFKNASYIVTDTYHGVLFSLINKKQFVVFIREPKDIDYSNYNKLFDLLNKIDLTSRWAKNPKDIENILETPINYNRIDEIRRKARESTITYLKENIC